MAAVRRSEYVFLFPRDAGTVDLADLLGGKVTVERTCQLRALSLLREDVFPLRGEEVELLLSVPAGAWVPEEKAVAGSPTEGAGRLARLVERGLVLSDGDEPRAAALRRRHEALEAAAWDPVAALYHFMSKWRDRELDVASSDDPLADLVSSSRDLLRELRDRHGDPPPAARTHPGAGPVHRLPLVERSHPLYELLRARRTTRSFRRDADITREELAVLLYWVFGCHGTVRLADDVVALKKTSPSGGGLHPVEAYPLVVGVEGLEPGLYHYEVESHALETLERMGRSEARELAREFVAGQFFLAEAQVLVLLTARFYRTYWKYRRHRRAYAVVLMDAAHLSQTFYLVGEELGLGTFVTAAVNSGNIEDRLGLDPVREGALAVCGCGVPRTEGPGLEPDFAPFAPGDPSASRRA